MIGGEFGDNYGQIAMKQLVSKSEKSVLVQPYTKAVYHVLLANDNHTVISLGNGQFVEIVTDDNTFGIVNVYSSDPNVSVGEA